MDHAHSSLDYGPTTVRHQIRRSFKRNNYLITKNNQLHNLLYRPKGCEMVGPYELRTSFQISVRIFQTAQLQLVARFVVTSQVQQRFAYYWRKYRIKIFLF